MSSPPAQVSWEQILTRRLRALVRTGPLHQLEAHKSHRELNLSAQDLRALALRAIDTTIEHMGLGYGARRKDLRDSLAPLIQRADPQVSAPDLHTIAELVIDALLNDGQRRVAFEVSYLSLEGDGSTIRSVVFHLLREEEADDGSVVIKATTEAINLYAGMLEVDVEDAQTAAEAVLAAQIQRGAIGAAVATARNARLRSIEFAEKVRGLLRRARRDIGLVDVQSLLTLVAQARQHLEERLGVERSLLDSVEDRVPLAELREVHDLVDLRDTLVDCRQRHLRLHQELLSSQTEWLDQQEHQRFRRHHSSALPDPERDLFLPLLDWPRQQLLSILDPLLGALHGPNSPKVMGMAALVDALLQPRRRESEPELESVHEDHEPIAAEERRFAPEVQAAVQAHLAQGGALSTALQRSRLAQEPPVVRRLLVLRSLWAWDPDVEDKLRAEAAGALLDPEYQGRDLTLCAPVSSTPPGAS